LSSRNHGHDGGSAGRRICRRTLDAFPAPSAIPCFGGRHGCDPYGHFRMALLDGVSRSQLRKRPDPALRQRLIRLPLGPSCESLETAPIPGRSPVVPHFPEVDDTATDARDRPGRRLRPVDVGAPTFDVGLSHRPLYHLRSATKTRLQRRNPASSYRREHLT
jgi:hypothetical protein